MSTFGFYEDAPFKIVNEGRQITITLEKLPNKQAKVSWTLPGNITNCSLPPREYNGIVIVLDNVPIKLPQTPKDGDVYIGDNTASRTLHAGDKLDTGLVVAALYDDKTTASIIINDIVGDTPYYIAGFAVDNVYRYHTEGVHTYSLPYDSGYGTDSTNGYQIVTLNTQLSNLTGLDANTLYNLDVSLDGNPLHTYQINGGIVATYGDLLNELNRQFALQLNPTLSPNVPNLNNYYVDVSSKKLYQWDGTTHIEISNILFSDVQPDQPVIGQYWVDTNNKLYQWNGSTWFNYDYISSGHPINQLKCNDIWFDSVYGYIWDGTVWVKQETYVTDYDPSAYSNVKCGTYWYDETNNVLNKWVPNSQLCTLPIDAPLGTWQQVPVVLWGVDPYNLELGTYWFDLKNELLYEWSGSNGWVDKYVNVVDALPGTGANHAIFYERNTTSLYVYNVVDSTWNEISAILYNTDPTIPQPGNLWWDTQTDNLYKWDDISDSWVLVESFIISAQDPSIPEVLEPGTLWYYNGVLKCWDGSKWKVVEFFYDETVPQLQPGDYWYNNVEKTWNNWDGQAWERILPIFNDIEPTVLPAGYFWFNLSNNTLNVNGGGIWIPVGYSTTSLAPLLNSYWYDIVGNILYQWDGTKWDVAKQPLWVEFNDDGDFKFISNTLGSKSSVLITPNSADDLFNNISISHVIQPPEIGADAIPDKPMYMELGIGTDGSADERRHLIENILMNFGYPVVQVELTKEQLELCVDRAISNLRRLSGGCYTRSFFFMILKPNQQKYVLSNISQGFNKIVSVLGIKRMTSAFLGTAGGQGVYGQMVLQHLYSMGTYDLVSYHIISEYVELMERMFATNIQYTWNERTRVLGITQNIWKDERVLVEASVEKTEQDILSDRYMKDWCLNWAIAEACNILAEIRGKYSNLPAAGGGISLNASDLRNRAAELFAQCRVDIDENIVSGLEEFGLGAQLVWG